MRFSDNFFLSTTHTSLQLNVTFIELGSVSNHFCDLFFQVSNQCLEQMCHLTIGSEQGCLRTLVFITDMRPQWSFAKAPILWSYPFFAPDTNLCSSTRRSNTNYYVADIKADTQRPTLYNLRNLPIIPDAPSSPSRWSLASCRIDKSKREVRPTGSSWSATARLQQATALWQAFVNLSSQMFPTVTNNFSLA